MKTSTNELSPDIKNLITQIKRGDSVISNNSPISAYEANAIVDALKGNMTLKDFGVGSAAGYSLGVDLGKEFFEKLLAQRSGLENIYLGDTQIFDGKLQQIGGEVEPVVVDQIALRSRLLLRNQPQLSGKHIDALNTITKASPQTLDYIMESGGNSHQAHQEYQTIHKNPVLSEYYLTMTRQLSSVLHASQTIHSGIVENSQKSVAEQILSLAHCAAGSLGFGLGIATGMAKFLATAVGERDRKLMTNRVTTWFPDLSHIQRVEILARHLTLTQTPEITDVSSQASGKRLIEAAKEGARWLRGDDIDTPVKMLAATQAERLLRTMMNTDPAKPFELRDVPKLASWATGKMQQSDIAPPRTRTFDPSSLPASSASRHDLQAVKSEIELVKEENVELKGVVAKFISDAKQKEEQQRKRDAESAERIKKLEEGQSSSVSVGTQMLASASLPVGRSGANNPLGWREVEENRRHVESRLTHVEQRIEDNSSKTTDQGYQLQELNRKKQATCCAIQ